MIGVGSVGIIMTIPYCLFAIVELVKDKNPILVCGISVTVLAVGIYLLFTQHIYSTKKYHKSYDSNNPRRS